MTQQANLALGLALERQRVQALAADLQGHQRVTAAMDLKLGTAANDSQADVIPMLGQAVRQALTAAGWNGHRVVSIGLAVDPAATAAGKQAAAHLVGCALPGGWARSGQQAGRLTDAAAKLWGLPAGISVAMPMCSHRAAVAGLGVAEPSTLAAVLRPGYPLLLNSRQIGSSPYFDGPLQDGILPGYWGYQIKEPRLWAVLRQITSTTADQSGLAVETGSGHLLPRADEQDLPGRQRLHVGAGLLVRQAADRLREAGIFCRRFVVAGELPREHPSLVQAMANVLQERVTVHPAPQPAALGAAVLGVLGAMSAGRRVGPFASMSAAVHALARARPDRLTLQAKIVAPDRRAADRYDRLYQAFSRG